MKLNIEQLLKDLGLLGEPHIEFAQFDRDTFGDGEIYVEFVDAESLRKAVEAGKAIAAALPKEKEIFVWAPALSLGKDDEFTLDNWPVEFAKELLRDNSITKVDDAVIKAICDKVAFYLGNDSVPWITFTIADKNKKSADFDDPFDLDWN